MGAVLWCEKTLSFLDFAVCEYCTGMDFSTVVKRLVTFKKISLCWGIFPCGGDIDIPVTGIFPCAGEIDFFGVKIPVLFFFGAL